MQIARMGGGCMNFLVEAFRRKGEERLLFGHEDITRYATLDKALDMAQL